jgi:hypothetical protein
MPGATGVTYGYSCRLPGEIVTDPDEDRLTRHLVADKYRPAYCDDLSTWRDTALLLPRCPARAGERDQIAIGS